MYWSQLQSQVATVCSKFLECPQEFFKKHFTVILFRCSHYLTWFSKAALTTFLSIVFTSRNNDCSIRVFHYKILYVCVCVWHVLLTAMNALLLLLLCDLGQKQSWVSHSEVVRERGSLGSYSFIIMYVYRFYPYSQAAINSQICCW